MLTLCYADARIRRTKAKKKTLKRRNGTKAASHLSRHHRGTHDMARAYINLRRTRAFLFIGRDRTGNAWGQTRRVRETIITTSRVIIRKKHTDFSLFATK